MVKADYIIYGIVCTLALVSITSFISKTANVANNPTTGLAVKTFTNTSTTASTSAATATTAVQPSSTAASTTIQEITTTTDTTTIEEDEEIFDKGNDCSYVDDKDSCYADIAYETSNITLCSKINDTEIKDYCYSDIAVNENNFDNCNPISDDYTRDDCYMTILLDTNSKDAAICNKMKTDLKEDCMEEVQAA